MKPSDFARHLTAFFGEYLPRTRNLSPNTISAYRDAFKLLLLFCDDNRGVPPEKLTLQILDDGIVNGFLGWLQSERNCGISTRNQRLAAIHAFFRYVQVREPARLLSYQKILQIPFEKHQRPIVQHLTPEQTRMLLASPNAETKTGRRNMTLLSVLYDTAARVQELCDLRIKDIRLEHPAMATLTGKGRKTRHVPLLDNIVGLLRSYMEENNFVQNDNPDTPLFCNQRRSKLTRGGVNHILQKYFCMVASQCSDMPKTLTPHTLRHSKAMHLYQSGVNLVYIRDILGHADIATTDIYARADMESKRKVLENAYPGITPEVLPEWNRNEGLLAFLNGF
jgi:site-specific recombinase XerD